MTHKGIIDHHNVVQATQFLLALESHAIADLYQLDAHHWVHALQEAFDRYYNHLHQCQQKHSSESIRKTVLDQHLESLVHHANNLVNIITAEAKTYLMTSLANQRTSLPFNDNHNKVSLYHDN